MTNKKQDELSIIINAKNLCNYIFIITDKSPKKFRFSLVSRLQNLFLNILENVFKANELYLPKSDKANQRFEYQRNALTQLKLLGYIAQLSKDQNCITKKQYGKITMKISDCQKLLGGWLNSLCNNVLRDFFEKHLIYDNGACKIVKSTHFSMHRLTKFMRDFYKVYNSNGYILKCDIKKYFASINKEILKKMLICKIPDVYVLNLIIKILDSYNTPNGKGLPIGNQTSQWFGLYYLDKMDRLVADTNKYDRDLLLAILDSSETKVE